MVSVWASSASPGVPAGLLASSTSLPSSPILCLPSLPRPFSPLDSYIRRNGVHQTRSQRFSTPLLDASGDIISNLQPQTALLARSSSDAEHHLGIGTASLVSRRRVAGSSFSKHTWQKSPARQLRVVRTRGLESAAAAFDLGGTAVYVATLLSFSAFFSLSETSITTLWPWKIRELAMREGPSSPFYAIRQDISKLLTSLLIGNTFANIAATAVLTQALKPWMGPSGVGVAGILILLFCEIMPKAIAVRHPVPVARFVVYPLSLIALILYPLGQLSTFLASRMLKMFGFSEVKAPIVSELELRMVLNGAEISGEVTNAEADMVENVLELGNIAVEKVMTPLVDVTAVDVNASLMDMWALWKDFQYSRVPVYSKRVDNIVGIAFSRDLVNFIDRPDIMEEAKVTSIMEAPPLYVPQGMTVRKMLQEFQTRNLHIAVVVNEYGGVVGLVTMEDVLEEIVGDIFDETDALKQEDDRIRARKAGVWDVSAETSIDELENVMGVKFPETQAYETLAGYVLERSGMIPTTGFAFNATLPSEHIYDEDEHEASSLPLSQTFRFLVTDADPRSVQHVRIETVEHAHLHPHSALALQSVEEIEDAVSASSGNPSMMAAAAASGQILDLNYDYERGELPGDTARNVFERAGITEAQFKLGKHGHRLDRIKNRKARIARLFESMRADGVATEDSKQRSAKTQNSLNVVSVGRGLRNGQEQFKKTLENARTEPSAQQSPSKSPDEENLEVVSSSPTSTPNLTTSQEPTSNAASST